MSIAGLASRHPLAALGAAAGLWWLWPASSSSPPPPPHVQAAVLADGFAAIDGANRILELDDAAARRREITLIDAPAGGRVVGLGRRMGLVWRDGKQIALAAIDRHGYLESAQKLGKRVAAVCEGVASSEHRFGVAWREADGSIWFVHGPTGARGDAPGEEALAEPLVAEPLVAEPAADPAKSDFCAIASAGDQLALLVTEGSRTTLTLCARQCSSTRRIELPKNSAVLGFGCTRGACVVATRGAGGVVEATWVSAPQGRAQWTRPLPHARPDTRVALAGTATQVALAYATSNEPVVVTASKTGVIETVWQDAADEVPGLVYARGRLLVARHTGGELAGSIVGAP